MTVIKNLCQQVQKKLFCTINYRWVRKATTIPDSGCLIDDAMMVAMTIMQIGEANDNKMATRRGNWQCREEKASMYNSRRYYT